MVHTIIFAGGTGRRMQSADIPKQFIEVDGVPIIIRTLQQFANHPAVDDITIACIESGISHLEDLIARFQIPKIKAILPGGETGYRSIHNALMEVAKDAAPDDIALICDGVRPMISEKLITECIELTQQYGTAVPVVRSIDSVLISMDGNTTSQHLPREQVYITQAPQGYFMRTILRAHEEVDKRGLKDPTSSADLMIELGEEVHIFQGERENIKVTTPEDLYTLRSHYYYQHYRRFAREELM